MRAAEAAMCCVQYPVPQATSSTERPANAAGRQAVRTAMSFARSGLR
jgi:hypothetical protein